MKQILYVLGAVLVVVGVLGFFNDPILGIFEVDAIHNIVHLLTGALLLWVAYSGGEIARMGAKVFGVVYALVAILGLLTAGNVLGIFESNGADTILHAALAVILLYVGFVMKEEEGVMASA